MNGAQRFEKALYAVCERLRAKLEAIPPELKQKTEEIRLRAGKPVAMTVDGETHFLNSDSSASSLIQSNTVFAESRDLEESFRLLCAVRRRACQCRRTLQTSSNI